MTTPAALPVLGLVLSLIGVVLLFRSGMPYRVQTGGAFYRVISPEDASAKLQHGCTGFWAGSESLSLLAPLLQ